MLTWGMSVYKPRVYIQLLLVVVPSIIQSYACNYTSIFSFGDSLADTGSVETNPYFFPPYGESYFHHPAGRYSNGRLVVDFIAESLGLPLLKPYLPVENSRRQKNKLKKGVNFAVAGATALDLEFFRQRQISLSTDLSHLNVQLKWFKELLPFLCPSSSSCKRYLRKSLILMGEIGGNDFNYALSLNRSIEEIETFVPHVLHRITSVIKELIDLGAVTFIVPGNLPIGCSPIYLKMYSTTHQEEYDEAGCIKWLNNFAKHYGQQLRAALHQLQLLHPHTNILYADYFNIAQDFYHAPKKYGFTGSTLKACCGGGGPYNFNVSSFCGSAGAKVCDDPSKYVSWDGIHYTEATYKWIARGILHGLYTNPKTKYILSLNKLCSTTSASI